MKRYIFLAIALFSIISSFAETDNDGIGTRIDFLNPQGERIGSTMLDVRYYDFPIFRIGILNNEFNIRPMVISSDNNYVAKVNMVPWGINKYPFTSSFDLESGITDLYYQIFNDDFSAPQSGKLVGTNDIQCGLPLRIFIKVPSGSYPKVSELYKYTMVSSDGTPYYNYTLEAFDPFHYSLWGWDGISLQARQVLNERYFGKSYYFQRSETDPDLWYYDTFMPNEPLELTFDIEYPDGKMLRQSANYALWELYSQDIFNQILHNDETFMMTNIGDYISEDYISGYNTVTNYQILSDVESFKSCNYWLNSTPWLTCFKYIVHSNLILKSIDQFTSATQAERDIVRAQMLTLRSHAYWRILQLYAPRWSESGNGSQLCAPLELTLNTEYQRPVTMKEIADQCYQDLDEARLIFRTNDYKRESIIEPDLNVATGVKMRLALLREDWVEAADCSKEIISRVPLTKNEEYTSGFYNPSESWIWGAWNNQPQELYYNSYQNFTACNGAYPALWGYGNGAIDRTLFSHMDNNDIRRNLFVMPENININNIGQWYNTQRMDENKLTLLGNLNIFARTWANQNKPEYANATPFQFENSYDVPIQFGAQTKFYQPGPRYDSPAAIPFMRTEEALLTHAEALFRLGDNVGAIYDLNTLNSMRVTKDYAYITPDADIFNEIKKARKIELWGEGFSFYDQKRWNLPIERKYWTAGDTQSGNWPSSYTGICPVDAANGWRMVVPLAYLQENKLMNLDELGYKDITGYTPASAPAKTKNKDLKVSKFDTRKETFKITQTKKSNKFEEFKTNPPFLAH